MKRNDIVAIENVDTRVQRAGKLKMGMRTAKAMRSLTEWRAISPFRDCIEAIAAIYGGEVRPYHDDKASPKDQFEVCTTSADLEVYLIPDGVDSVYELWSGGGCERRCDGVTVEIPVAVDNDYELQEHPCLCRAEGVRRCDPKTRVAVIIPDIPFRGSWLLETKSWTALAELPGMHDMIAQLGNGQGMVRARLSIAKEQKVVMGKTRNFVVPKLSMYETPLELAAGRASVAALTAGAAAALGTGQRPVGANVAPVAAITTGGPEDVVDAEVLDDELLEIEHALKMDGEIHGLDGARYLAAIRAQIGAVGPASAEQRGRMREASRRVREGELEPLGFTPDGRVQWKA